MLLGVLLGECNVEVAANVLDIEGRVPLWNPLVSERISIQPDGMKIRVIDIHVSLAKIGDIKKINWPHPRVIDRCNCDAFEYRRALRVYLNHRSGCVHSRVPARNCSVLSNEEKQSRFAWGNLKTRGAIEDLTRGCSGAISFGGGNGDDQGGWRTGSAIKGRKAGT